MTTQSGPELTRRANHRYHCADIAALHQWLETQSYQFYGQHNPGEYGRFSRQEAHEHDGQRSFVHSFIQVMSDGQVYSPDPLACQLLEALVTHQQEREV